jgi:hypothetical protein
MRYFVSFHYTSGRHGGYGNAVLEADGPITTWSDVQDLTQYAADHMRRGLVEVDSLTVLHFIPLSTALEG